MTDTLRLNDFWETLQTRLNSSRMSVILGGDARIYVPSDNANQDARAEGAANKPWGRIVLLARTTLWPQVDEPGAMKNLAFLVNVQFNDYRAPGYDVGIPVAAAHEEAYRLLDNYVPALARAQIAVPIWRSGAPSGAPMFDGGRGLHVSQAEYRTQVVPKAL